MIPTFSESNFEAICDTLGKKDKHLKSVIDAYGYPPMWTRDNSFKTLVHIILEQQVSLASALSALNKFEARLGEITPENALLLTDEEYKQCQFSRQKTTYTRFLAQALIEKRIVLEDLEKLQDEEVREILVTLKGIGNWTVDVYLMFVLRRTDLFPIGDLAAVNAYRQLKAFPKEYTKTSILADVGLWKPNRTVATMILWHFYLSERKKKP